MNIHMKIFRSQHFDPLRVVMLDDEPWYIVTDICRTLGYGNATKAVRLVRQEDKTIIHVPNLSVGSNPANAVNLSGLETLILRSRKREEAAAFSRWLIRSFPSSTRTTPNRNRRSRQRRLRTTTCSSSIGRTISSI